MSNLKPSAVDLDAVAKEQKIARVTEKHTLNPQTTIDGAGLESNEPQSEEPSGRSLRDGLSAAPSPVKPWLTVENCFVFFIMLILGCILGIFVLLGWAIHTQLR